MSEINAEFWPKNLNQRSHFSITDVSGRMWIINKCEYADWIKLDENGDELWAFCECLMNVSQPVSSFWLCEQILAIHEELCSTLGNNKIEGSWVIVTDGLWGAWPRNSGSHSGRGTNFVVSTILRVSLRSSMFMSYLGWSGWSCKATTVVCIVPR